MEWRDVKVRDLKPGDQVQYCFNDSEIWGTPVTVLRIGDVTVKTDRGSICQSAQFQRRQEAAPQWHDVAWDAIKVGDRVKVYAGPELKVETIGDRYFKAVEEYDLRCRYLSDVPPKENQWQRLEEPARSTGSYRLALTCRACRHSRLLTYQKLLCDLLGAHVLKDHVCDEHEGGEGR